ncbi:MAG: lipopolysaccharide biosynthesis protein [Candidatus Omnitrophica bacterium]|nr:lipopolysaccharide biosynthesis protein [Candidatus Omnitrophota bacterium]
MGVSLEFGLMGWVFFFCVGNSLFLVTTTYLRALRKPEKFTFFTSLLSLLTLFGTIALTFLLGANLTALMVGIGGSLFALGVWIPLATQDPKAALRWSESWGQVGASLRPLLHFGLPLAIHAASSQILNVSSRYIILILRGEEEAGIYSVVYRMADTFVRAILLALITTVYTSVTETYEKSGAAAAERIVGTYTRLFLLLTAPAAAGLALIQTEVVELLAGPSYVDGAHLVTWIAMGTLFLGLSHYQQFGLHLGHQTLRLAGMTLCAAILNVLITVGLAPTQGYSAAGYAAFASFLFLALVSPVISRKWLAWRMPWRLIAKIGIALLVMAAAVHGAGLLAEGLVARLALKVLVGALAYGVTVIALGELPLGALARASLRYRGPSEPGG